VTNAWGSGNIICC